MKEKTPKKRFASLTPREREVLRLVCQYKEYPEIAEIFVISESTVKTHMDNTFIKLGLKNLKRDKRVIALHTTYCPMFSEYAELAEDVEKIEILDPETIPLTPEEEKTIDGDDEENITYTPKPKKGGQGKMDPGKGRKRLKLVLVLIVAALIIFGGWQGLKLFSRTPIFSSGSTYEVGEWHKEDDLWFRVYKVEISDPLYIYFEIWNKSTDDIFFTWTTQQNISLVDNTGTSYVITEAFKYKEENVNLPAGTRYDLERVNYWSDPLYKENVTELLFSIEYFSRINKATWRIPVNK